MSVLVEDYSSGYSSMDDESLGDDNYLNSSSEGENYPKVDLVPIIKELKKVVHPAVEWCYTNTSALCYDCDLIIFDDRKGYGRGIFGVDLYFCHDCYLSRAENGQVTPIDRTTLFRRPVIDRIRAEFRYGMIVRDITNELYCFRCHDNESDLPKNLYLSRYKGITGVNLNVCEYNCYQELEKRDNFHKLDLNSNQLGLVRREIRYILNMEKNSNSRQKYYLRKLKEKSKEKLYPIKSSDDDGDDD